MPYLKIDIIAEHDAKLIIPTLQNSACPKWQLSDLREAR